MLFHDSQRRDVLANVCFPVPDRLKPTHFRHRYRQLQCRF